MASADQGFTGFLDNLAAQLAASRQAQSVADTVNPLIGGAPAAPTPPPDQMGLLGHLLGLGSSQQASAPGAPDQSGTGILGRLLGLGSSSPAAPMQLAGATPASADTSTVRQTGGGLAYGSGTSAAPQAQPSTFLNPPQLRTQGPVTASGEPVARAQPSPAAQPQGYSSPQGGLPTFAASVGTPTGANPNTQTALNFYQSKGLPPLAAAALVGGFTVESGKGLNTNALNPGNGSDGSNSQGIAQWNGSRAAGLHAFAAANGLDPSDINTQLQYSWAELNGPEKGTLAALQSAQNPVQATAAALGYERPAGWSAENPFGAKTFGQRLQATAGLAGAVGQGGAGGSPMPVRMAAGGAPSPYGAPTPPGAFGQQPGAALPTIAASGMGGALPPDAQFAAASPGQGAPDSTATPASSASAGAPIPAAAAYAPTSGAAAAPASQAIGATAAPAGQPYGSVPVSVNGRMMTRQQAEDAPEALDIDRTDYDRAAAAAGMKPPGAAPAAPAAPVAPGSAVATGAVPLAGQVLPPVGASGQRPVPNGFSPVTPAMIKALVQNPDTQAAGLALWQNILTNKVAPIVTHDGETVLDGVTHQVIYSRPTAVTPTDAMKNYAMAQSQGYTKSFTDYQGDQQKADKAQLIDVPLPNGQMQKVWATPGQDPKQGTPVGQPYTKGPASVVSIDSKGESAEAAEAGKNAANCRGDMLAAADAAPDKIARLNLLGAVLDRTQTGPLAGAAGTVVNVANSLGISPDAISALGLSPNQAVDNQIAQKLANELVMGSIGAKNGGFPASNFSVAERQFIEKTFPNIAAQPGANAAVNDVLVAREQRNIEKGDAWSAYKQQQKVSGQPLSYEDFEGQWQQQHSGDNIFAPIQQKFLSGGYSPVGASPPQPNPTNASPSGAPAAPPPPRVQVNNAADFNALPSGTRFIDPKGVPRIKP